MNTINHDPLVNGKEKKLVHVSRELLLLKTYSSVLWNLRFSRHEQNIIILKLKTMSYTQKL